MAERKRDKRKGFGKLLDAWVAPKDAGTPVGCVATSFTFSSSFFEEECLSRFLALETDPIEDGPLYLIEREERLSQAACTCAIVDQHHCKGHRSLRWDLLPARVRGGLLHAKVSLLAWSNTVRIVIASANLTEDGYRRNREVFGVFDYQEGGDAPIGLLQEVIAFIRLCANQSQPEPQSPAPALARVHALLERVGSTPPGWGRKIDEALHGGLRVYPVLIAPGRRHALESLTQLWPANVPPSEAHVISPFFDSPEAPNEPVRELWQRLRKRGKAWASYYLDADDLPEGKTLVHAPKSLAAVQPSGRADVKTFLRRIEGEENRSLHAKIMCLKDERWLLHMIGSSNFTSAGLGLSSSPNIEANVAYLVDSTRQPDRAKALEVAFSPSRLLSVDDVTWQGSLASEDEVPSEVASLPEAFGAATYKVDEEEHAFIEFSFACVPPPGWKVLAEDDEVVCLAEEDWLRRDKCESLTIDWRPTRPPSGFWVSWNDTVARAWWPVNVESSKSLPPPDELKSLSLELLIEILTSARPLHCVLGEYLKRRQGKERILAPAVLVDPHKRIDTSRFLLQRTRRVSGALKALRERLERPVATEESLHWRLHGPIGVRALSDALVREGQSPQEKAFLLSELALELARVKPVSLPGYLPASRVETAIREVIAGLQKTADVDFDGRAAHLKGYVRQVFESVLG